MFKENQIFAAPLAGITDKPYRALLRRFSPDAPILTEMISSHSIVLSNKNCLRNFDEYAAEGNIGAQIFGANPKIMADAAKIIESKGAKWIDINMGCPVAKVATRAGAGAYLMRDHALAGAIIKSVAMSVKIPVSIKTRLGWDDSNINWDELVKIAADNGAAFATLHGRTRASGYTGGAALPAKPDLPIPVIANGDIKTPGDAIHAENLGFDGVMIGRGLLGRPWAIAEILGQIKPSDINMGNLVVDHLEMVLSYYGEKNAVPLFRKHAAWYSLGMKNSIEFRIKVNSTTDVNALRKLIFEFFNCFDNI